MNLSVGNIISLDWHSSAEGETMLQHFYNPQTTGRKTFGILERPSIASNVEEVSYKLFVTGKSGIGKTATVARLAGSRCRVPHTETHGIQKSNIFWPVKIWDKIILFKLQIWDAGENAIKKYAHIFPLVNCYTGFGTWNFRHVGIKQMPLYTFFPLRIQTVWLSFHSRWPELLRRRKILHVLQLVQGTVYKKEVKR
ncbi:ciliogenesis and planar polarity effector 2-like isoform X2 [Schistocerca piceifrons]|uniref:ciliogenesis and planar polarity effector 2-like isoform X2 n=1 Tax=Schistocerca piceifrons TaxID=274613 RepID=UPI001F5E96F3|nr:ciliogenesis and planar polarity effector 2-like isoform X2 [Schistocerca piceifrons]